MEVLVTGAPGWLGTELVEELDERGHSIRCVTLPSEDTSELARFDVTTYQGDVRRKDSLSDALSGEVDVVFHCAGIIHPQRFFGADTFFAVNSEGTRNLLDVVCRHGVRRFIHVSSNAAQGFNDAPTELMTEEMPCQPESLYGKSKYQAERYVRQYQREYGIEFTIVRPCWYYGPRQPDRMNRLMNMIQKGWPVIFGDGTNLRSMTYVPSLVDALLSILDQPGAARNETYWIADEEPYTTNYVYRTIAELLGVEEDVRPIHVPGTVSRLMEIADVALGKVGLYEQNLHVAGEMSRNIACDPSKATEELGWDPPSDLTPGMRRGIDWARERGKI